MAITVNAMQMAGKLIEKTTSRFVRPVTAISIMEKRAVRTIRRNIQSHGHHVYDVLGGPLPPWSYSIGLSEKIGFEVILAGGLYFDESERLTILDGFIEHLMNQVSSEYKNLLGHFYLLPVSEAWPDELFLGAIDYYKSRPKFMQIYLDENSVTMDVPRLFEPWSAKNFPAWKWLKEAWKYSIPPESVVLTDTDMLGGHAGAEVACRFREDYWEIYSRQPEEIEDKYRRYSPLGTLLALHGDIENIVDLQPGQAIERLAGQSEWHFWGGRVSGRK